MSEIKGQLLGIILVLSVFGVVIGVLTAAFQRSAQTIQTRVEDAANTNTSTSVDPNARIETNPSYSLHY